MSEHLPVQAGIAQDGLLLQTEQFQTSQTQLQIRGSGLFDRLRSKGGALAAAAVLAIGNTLTPGLEEWPAYANAPPSAVIGMPFEGKWAWSASIDPPYTDSNSSHPSVHHTPGGGDWSTDLYATQEDQAVKFIATSAGDLSFSWGNARGSCGESRRINVLANDTVVGWLYFTHLSNAASTASPPTNGMTLGTVKEIWKDDEICNPGPHVHVEFRNNTNYSCYADQGKAGTTLGEGANLGVLGSSNNGTRQACAEIPSGGAGSESLTDGTFVRVNESGAIYRMVGGAPIRIYNQGALPDFNGQVTNISHARLGELPTYPNDEGDIISLVEAGGAKYRFVGGAPVRIHNCAALPGNCVGAINVNFQSLAEHDHMLQRPKDGAVLSIAEAGGAGIYRFVGGAPVRLFNWGAIPDMPGAVAVNQQSLAGHDHMNTRPSDGSVISIAEAGGSGIYRFVGGAPIRLFNWGAIPDMPAAITVNAHSLAVHDHMNERPANNAAVSLVEAGGAGIYRFVGGAPLRQFNWGVLPGFAAAVNINEQSLAVHDHMNTLPVNNEFIASAETGVVYRIAGGAAVRLYNHGGIPGFNGAVFVNQQTLDTADHLRIVPLNGTILRGVSSNTYWRINDGKRAQVGVSSTAVTVDEESIGRFPEQ